jgi:hypothetical protein
MDRDIVRLVELMQRQGMDVGLDGSYGQFAVTNKAENRKLSPRMANKYVYDWLWAFREGYDQGLVAGIKRWPGTPSDPNSAINWNTTGGERR